MAAVVVILCAAPDPPRYPPHTHGHLCPPRAARATGASLDLDAVRRLYGSGLAMTLATERRMAAGVGGRLPGLDAHPPSRAALDTLTGDDLALDFGDVMGAPSDRPEGSGAGGAAEAGPHAAVERRLGL